MEDYDAETLYCELQEVKAEKNKLKKRNMHLEDQIVRLRQAVADANDDTCRIRKTAIIKYKNIKKQLDKRVIAIVEKMKDERLIRANNKKTQKEVQKEADNLLQEAYKVS